MNKTVFMLALTVSIPSIVSIYIMKIAMNGISTSIIRPIVNLAVLSVKVNFIFLNSNLFISIPF